MNAIFLNNARLFYNQRSRWKHFIPRHEFDIKKHFDVPHPCLIIPISKKNITHSSPGLAHPSIPFPPGGSPASSASCRRGRQLSLETPRSQGSYPPCRNETNHWCREIFRYAGRSRILARLRPVDRGTHPSVRNGGERGQEASQRLQCTAHRQEDSVPSRGRILEAGWGAARNRKGSGGPVSRPKRGGTRKVRVPRLRRVIKAG